MSGVQREDGVVPGDAPGPGGVPGIVARLGGPIWVDMSPCRVRVTCRGVTAVGPTRAAAIRALADAIPARLGPATDPAV
jgi:hypothetical protein